MEANKAKFEEGLSEIISQYLDANCVVENLKIYSAEDSKYASFFIIVKKKHSRSHQTSFDKGKKQPVVSTEKKKIRKVRADKGKKRGEKKGKKGINYIIL